MTTTTQLESMEVSVPPALVAQIEGRCPSPADVATAMATSFTTLFAAVERNGVIACGPPRAIYTSWSPAEVRFTAAVPVDKVPATAIEGEPLTVVAAPEAVALRFVHRGPYRDIRTTYGRIEAWLRERGGIKSPEDWARYAPMWEEYLNDPATTPESKLVTRIYLTLR